MINNNSTNNCSFLVFSWINNICHILLELFKRFFNSSNDKLIISFNNFNNFSFSIFSTLLFYKIKIDKCYYNSYLKTVVLSLTVFQSNIGSKNGIKNTGKNDVKLLNSCIRLQKMHLKSNYIISMNIKI